MVLDHFRASAKWAVLRRWNTVIRHVVMHSGQVTVSWKKQVYPERIAQGVQLLHA